MVGAGKDVLHEVFAAHGTALGSHAATALRAVLGEGGTLNITLVADGDDHLLVGDGVLDAEVGGIVFDGRAAIVAILLAQFLQFLFDDLHQHIVVAEYFLAALNEAHFLIVLVLQLLVLQAGKLGQTHVDDGAGLQVAELVALHQALAGLVGRLAGADECYYLVDDVDGAQQSGQDVGTLLGLGHLKARAAGHHLLAVLHKVLYQLLEVQQLRTAVHQRNIVHCEARLQLGELEQLVEDDIGHHIVAQHVDHTDAVLVALVADVEDAFNLTFLHQVGGLLDHLALVHTIGDGGGHNQVVAFGILLNSGVGAQDDAAAAGGIGLAHTVVAVDNAAQREVGRLDILHQTFDVDVIVVNVGHAAVQHLAQVVRGHIGGHADGDAVGAVDQQVGNLGGQHRGFLALVVIGGHHVHRVFVDVGHQLVAYLLQARLGVTHGCRRVAVDRAEVTLPVDQRVAHRPILGQAHQGAVDARVAVGVILTHHIAHYAGALLGGSVVKDAVLVHRIEDAAVHRLEAVAHIGQRSRHDDRHSIVDVGRLHRLFDVDTSDFFVFRCH